mmetsp:Transcript_20742/g.30561  ORF Transcript_20742/g.30561 Transcript_20742/m.30561 type:complete len:198 (-) Transcript_20742:120-713(-)|eukprot:CAMPEP_0195510362 /NCGR_PEP_ID=MMETSP0794_2-20130614/3030_1 /TAXON_ID=515487 /ORGANISM="Stephanopyxis turris, Strain CCMP 815" /LENGTH=197 /DNA_ID=CAMNT_0040637771 /DNA_START=169 /DNA_END=762 /DNA_ORIENTATION=-
MVMKNRYPEDDETTDKATEEEYDIMTNAIYESILSSICVEFSCGMHRLAKTGVLPYSEIMTPSSNEEIESLLITISDDDSSTRGCKRKHRSEQQKKSGISGKFSSLSDGIGNGGSSAKAASMSQTTHMAPATRVSSGANGDIWARVPPKEPKHSPQCPNCGRSVSASRFASHLDKCMGIGNSRGGVGVSGTRASSKS